MSECGVSAKKYGFIRLSSLFNPETNSQLLFPLFTCYSVKFPDTVYALEDDVTIRTSDVVDGNGLIQIKDSQRFVDPIAFNVTSPPDIDFTYFSGNYEAVRTENSVRPYYWQNGPEGDSTAGLFYYCKYERAWVFTVQAFTKTGILKDRQKEDDKEETGCRYGWLMKSPITESYGLDESGKIGLYILV